MVDAENVLRSARNLLKMGGHKLRVAYSSGMTRYQATAAKRTSLFGPTRYRVDAPNDDLTSIDDAAIRCVPVGRGGPSS